MRNHTELTALLDRSGSMKDIKGDVIGGFNQFLEDQKRAGANASLTLVQFDSQSIDTVYESLPIRDCDPLTELTFLPRAGTPLLDAIGQSIERAGERLAQIPERDRPDKVVFVIQTDGLENASVKYTKSQIREMISHQEQTYKWQFVYLGANQDAFSEAHTIGVNVANAATFKATAKGVRASYAVASANLASYRHSGDPRDLNFTPEQIKGLIAEDDDEKPETPQAS